ncbi:Uu.00g098700.m01.CDS01 [Anthostomella pinea]|uniref:Uu.00g098700.m01.CDS01 n=1 Tax=Anthostomella pinea TaxID=933095 RepID=A0AAI8VCQ8_9PEZI|nr:Uu.00g098700.m01.CDS01 [Anthostomella pinea]
MPQGSLKKAPTPSAGKKQPAKIGKGARVYKAKKGSSADKLQKKYSAGLVARTEKLLGERAGHLELIGKGKKARNEKGKDGEKKVTGGSRKFG